MLMTFSDWLRAMGPGVANHFWQSTAFAAAAWVVTLLLRRNRAGVRYGVWVAASLKFLLPFSRVGEDPRLSCERSRGRGLVA